MGSIALPISGVVNVGVVLSSSGAQAQNTTTLLALTPSVLLDLVTRIASFPTLAAVGTFFGTEGPEFSVAQLWFAQSPQPTSIEFGRWAQTAAAGLLVGAPLTPTEELIANFSGIADGGFSVSIDGAGVVHVGTIVLTGVQNLNAVATAINAELVGATCSWNGINFVFTSATTGANSAVSFLTAPAAGPTDISGLLGCTQATQGSYLSHGQIAETALAAVTLFDNQYGEQWYALTLPTGVDADNLAVGPFVEGTTNKHFLWVTSQDANCLLPTSTTDIAFKLAALNLTHTAVQYSSTNPYAIVSAAARILTVDYTANASAITLNLKQEPLVAAENLSQTQYNALIAKNCNVFVVRGRGTTVFQPGTTCSTNQFIDTIIGVDNLAIDVQLAIFDELDTTPTKVAQTDAGMHQLITAVEAVLIQYVSDGLVAPGTWTQAGFGALNEGDFMEKGYYLFAPPVSTQLPAPRAARIAVPIQIAVKLAGAIQQVSATIFVNP
jgi:hypothetical protein